MAEVIIIGAGAAGLFAAGAACAAGHTVTVLEHGEKPGRKLLITGKGRCNVANNCTEEEFLKNVRRNPRFLYSALHACSPAAVMALFEHTLGVPLKTERGRRVFPQSDRAQDVLDALLRYAQQARIVYHADVKSLLLSPLTAAAAPETEPAGTDTAANISSQAAPSMNKREKHAKKEKPKLTATHKVTGVLLRDGRRFAADAVIVATGGVSYPVTGSTGDGYRLAAQAGHTVVPPEPSLVSLVEDGGTCKKMMGLSLRNVSLTLWEGEKSVFQEQGEMLFTHFGVSGPLVLSASAHIRDMKKYRYRLTIDCKPALPPEKLQKRVNEDFALLANKDAANCLVKLLPASMQPVMLEKWGVPPDKRVNQITREERAALVQLLKAFPIALREKGDLAHAVITSGGVDVKQVDPATMGSKLCEGLYFAGEVLDVDAYTGGYNLGIAFATAYAAATHLA